MNEVESTLKIAQGISEFGFMTIVCSIFLILSASLMIVSFKWFKGIIEQIIKDFSAQLETLQQTANRNGEAMVDIAEGLMPETQLRIKNTSGVYFDLATEKVCRMIKKIRGGIDHPLPSLSKNKSHLRVFTNPNGYFSRFPVKKC